MPAQPKKTPSSPSRSVPAGGAAHPTACFNCRTARQKCDRQEPCERCTNHGLACRFPPRSFRGRKQGSTNKPDTVEKLLARIAESSVGEEVIAAIIRREERKEKQPPSRDPSEHGAAQEALISPLQILAAAVEADRSPHASSNLSIGQTLDASGDGGSEAGRGLSPSFRGSHAVASSSFMDERLAKYFGPRCTDRTDWEILALQPLETSFKLDTAAFDPVSARLVNQEDIALYFQLFYELRNPYVGLLDPALHTPEFVRASSFTLFSVVCAAGCAMSTRPRDRLLHPALNTLAEDGIKWSIGSGVRSIETVQAIVYGAYTSTAYERQCDDPYWLRISHATQLARELGLDRPGAFTRRMKSLSSLAPDVRGRLIRNAERTWLYAFIVDKSFGVMAGRSPTVSWRELPTNLSDWWSRPYSNTLDYVVQGLVEMRVAYLKSIEDRRRLSRSADAVVEWHQRTSSTLRALREAWCDSTDDTHPCAKYIPHLQIYMTHGMLLVNGQALRQVIALEATTDTKIQAHLSSLSDQTVNTAIEYIDFIALGPYMRRVSKGISNTAFIQANHAATEILLAIKRSSIPPDSIPHAVSKIKLVAEYLDDISRAVPASSWAPIYASLAQGFVYQVNAITESHDTSGLPSRQAGQQPQSADTEYWWKQPMPFLEGVDGDFDYTGVFDVGFLGTAPEVPGMMDFDYMSGLDNESY